MSEYSEKFKDPRWQKLRLELLNEGEWTCESCGAETKSLNVHHKFYRKKADPWDYANEDFKILCEDCHRDIHIELDRLKDAIGELTADEVARVAGYATAMNDGPNQYFIDFTANYSMDMKSGWCDYYRTTIRVFDSLIRDGDGRSTNSLEKQVL